jgi:hypothetical protein
MFRVLFLLSQQSARLSVDEVQPSAGLADNRFVFVALRIVIVVQPVLDAHAGRWTGK